MPEDIEALARRGLISPTQMEKLRASINPVQQLSEQDAAAMQPETYVNPVAKRIVGAAGGALGDLATLPRRALEASAQDVQHLGEAGYQPQSTGPALEAAMLPMGTGAIAGAPVRAGEAVLGAGPVRTYKPGNISFAEVPTARAASVSADHEVEDALGNSYLYDVHVVRDGDNVHGAVTNLRAIDENGEPITPPSLSKVQRHKLQKDIKESVRDHLQDEADLTNETLRRRSLGPEGRAQEDAAAAAAQRQKEASHTDVVNQAVDDALASGWRPSTNANGGLSSNQPQTLKQFASPDSQAKIKARLAEKGFTFR